MKIIKTLFLLLLGSMSSIALYAQKDEGSSDAIQIHNLYDVSGSIFEFKQQNNLSYFFKTVNQIDGEDIRLGKEFSLSFFGEESKLNSKKTLKYQLSDKDNKASKKLLTFYNNEVKKAEENGLHQKTDLLTALKKLLKDSINFQKNDALFIYTDGILQKRDIPSSLNIVDYRQELDGIIDFINNNGVTTFLVYTAPEQRILNFSNTMHLYADTIQYIENVGSFGENYFWLNSSVDINTSKEAQQLYEDFIMHAKYKLIKYYDRVSYTQHNTYDKLYVLSNILSMEKSNFIKFKNELAYANSEPFHNFLALNKRASINPLKENIKISSTLETVKSALETKSLQEDDLKNVGIELQFILSDSIWSKISNAYFELKQISGQEKSAFYNLKTDTQTFTGIEAVNEPTISRSTEEALIIGLSDYLIKRSKLEATYTFYHQIYEKVILPSSFIKDTLFYNLSETLESQGSFGTDPVVLKECFLRDIKNILPNMISHPLFYENEGLKIIRNTLLLTENIYQTKSFEKAIIQFSQELRKQNYKFSPFEKSILLSADILSFAENRDLVHSLSKLDPEKKELLCKLIGLWHVSNNTSIGENYLNFQKINNHVMHFLSEYQNIKKELDVLKKTIEKYEDSGDIKNVEAYKLDYSLLIIKKCFELVKVSTEFYNNLTDNANTQQLEQAYASYLRQVDAAIDAWIAIQKQNYPKAGALLINLMPDLLPFSQPATLSQIKEFKKFKYRFSEQLKKDKQTYIRLKKEIDNLNYEELDSLLKERKYQFLSILNTHYKNNLKDSVSFIYYIESIYNKLDSDVINTVETKKLRNLHNHLKNTELENDVYIKFLSQYLEYPEYNNQLKKLVMISAEVSSAKTASEVQKVLEKHALPVASYRVKRNQNFTLMVNAYTGLNGILQGDFQSFALSAPIGLEASMSILKRNSIGFFVPIIDVGNIINYRLGNDDINENDIIFSNIFSPGLQLVYGLSDRIPLSVNVGYQANPDRLVIGLNFDLPIWRLH